MVASPEPDEGASFTPTLLEHGRGTGPRPEVLGEWVFRPLADLVVAALVPVRVSPVVVVLANMLAGLAAAVAIARGQLVAAALLLQLKTVLDNADGQLARASGRSSVLGRYLDTEADLVVNVAVFAALAYETGSPVLALVALVALTFVLSANFNERALYARARGETVVTQPSATAEGRFARSLARLYAALFAPQDRALQSLAQRRLERVLDGVRGSGLRERATLAYHDNVTSAILANLGLSTQFAVLGLCLLAGAPVVYLWLALAAGALVPLLQLRRELVARRALTRKSDW